MTPRSPLLPQKTLGSADPRSFPVSGDGFGMVSRVFEGPDGPESHNLARNEVEIYEHSIQPTAECCAAFLGSAVSVYLAVLTTIPYCE